ncbi:MAG: LptE family protein [Candidatus Binatia bacterium]|nr:LptE family protein [Candidatus Binatia bacterium]
MVRWLAVVVSLGIVGCGYHFPGDASVLPGGGTTVYVSTFTNQSREPGLENGVRDALEDEILRRGNFELVSEDTADVVLEGVIESLQSRPIAFSNSDEALQYETVMTLSASLLDTRRKALVWRVANLRESDSFGAVPGTVVVQSSQFQEQSTLNQQNLAQLTEVQLSESQKDEAIERVLENMSRDLYNSMVEDF